MRLPAGPGGPDGGEAVSDRQKARDQRKEAFWSAKYAAARGARERLAVAFDEIRAAVEDLPADQQDDRRDQVTVHLRQIAKAVTESQVHSRQLHSGSGSVRPSTRPAATRARARRQV